MYVHEIRNVNKQDQMSKKYDQGLVKEEKFCFRYLDFYFQHGDSTSTASQLTFSASQKKSRLKQSSSPFRKP